ncbi:hypothetical protein CO670_15300 [Rhizobium sp. J15]|nr:hypothetical protein CO670_15300 [Rhizobium sp. J15]
MNARDHLARFPHARTSTVVYLQKKDEMTELLRQGILQEQLRRTPLPWWRRVLSAIRGGGGA